MRYLLNILLMAAMSLFAACGSDFPQEGKYPSVGEEDPGGDPVPPDPGPDVPGETCKILFIGNSLTLDATTLLPDMLNAAGVKNVEMTRIFHGAYTLPLYNDTYSDPDVVSMRTWKAGDARWSGDETFKYSPEEAVKADDYDIICIQEYSGNACAWSWTPEEEAAVTGLIEKIRASQGDNDPEIVFMFSHTFGKGYERLVNNFGDDNVKQFEACAGMIRQLLEVTGISRVISTAAVIQNLRTTGLNHEHDLTRGDGVHLDYGLGRYAAACVVFKTLITPVSGARIEDNPFRFSEYYPHKALYTTPVTDENVPVVHKAVEAACEKPLEITDMSSYGSRPDYLHKVDLDFAEKNADIPEGCTFPVEFPLGNGAVDSYLQPYWSGYGLWICPSQEQAYARWKYVSYPIEDMLPTRTWANDGAISSVALRGIWTGDYLEFVIPVESLEAGTTVRFKAPFYTRQGPVFWIFEWFDGGEWKSEIKDVSSWDGKFTQKASFAIGLGTTVITQDAVFSEPISDGFVRIRVRCADGTVQADSATGSAVKRDLPNHTATDLSSVFYFYGTTPECGSVSFSKI